MRVVLRFGTPIRADVYPVNQSDTLLDPVNQSEQLSYLVHHSEQLLIQTTNQSSSQIP